jgi:lipoprotein-anchoring transpeptidase ErfK/SrfK
VSLRDEEVERAYREALRAARAALGRGDREEAQRWARLAAKLAPEKEAPWIFLAAASDPRPALDHLTRALEINPSSQPARKAFEWNLKRLPPEERKRFEAERQAGKLPLLEMPSPEALTRRRVLSIRSLLPALFVVLAVGLWIGSQPAAARQPQMAPAQVGKATYTPTITLTPTPTITPTPTPTSTPTSTPTPTVTPTPRPAFSWVYSTDPAELANEGRWIDVDLSDQVVIAYEGTTAVRMFQVSTGTARHPTVTGMFRIYLRLRYTDMAGPGYYLPDVPYTMYFYRGYSLHGTYWHHNFGTPMSHGCVNMRTSEAAWLFDFASLGTIVNVHP